MLNCINIFWTFRDLSNVENSIETSLEALMTIFESNDFDVVISLAEPYVGHSLYHSALKSEFLMLKAGLTLDKVNKNYFYIYLTFLSKKFLFFVFNQRLNCVLF